MCQATRCATLPGTITSGEAVDALDAKMEAVLTAGRKPSAADFGGLDPILGEAMAIARSHYAPEFVSLVVDGSDNVNDAAMAFAGKVVEHLDNDFAINAVVDWAAGRRPLPEPTERQFFRRWLALAGDRDASASVRTAALRGALLMKRQDSRRALQLAGFVVASELDDEPDFLAHAARVGGFLHAESPNPGIVSFLEDLLDVADAADEASFELGMDQVGSALRAVEGAQVLARLRQARSLFEAASARREARADARVLSLAIGLLDDFYEKRSDGWAERLQDLSREAFAYSAYSGQEDDFLNGAKTAEVAAWGALAVRLGSLTPNLGKPAWWDAARIIEGELLAVYSASRTIFRRGEDGGLEWVVRPRIEEYVSLQRQQLYVLRDWLGANPLSEHGAAATELIVRAEAALGMEGSSDPQPAAAEGSTVAAILEQGELPIELQARVVRETLADVNAFEFRQVSPPLMEAVTAVHLTFKGLRYYEQPKVRAIVRSLVYKTLLFLEDRLDLTAGVDPAVAYLFVEEGQPNPHEKALQQDYMASLRRSRFGTVDEVRGVGGGRADVAHQVDGIRFVTEVKREETDASFANLLASYGDQTALYQNTNIPVGMLLVLDLTTSEGLPGHFRTLYHPKVGELFGDGLLRGVLVVRVPARKIPPSAATERAKRAISAARAEKRRQERAEKKAADGAAGAKGQGRKRQAAKPILKRPDGGSEESD